MVSTANFQQKLYMPSEGGPLGVLDVTRSIKIKAAAASLALLRRRESPFLLYETDYAGKAYKNLHFRLESVGRFTASLDNALTQVIIILWHSVHTPSVMDGHPRDTISSGGRYDYDFTVHNRGGTYWHHTYAHKLTAGQAHYRLASFFLVEDNDLRSLTRALDLQLGVTDLPIVTQDKQFDAQGKLHYRPGMNEAMMG